MLDNDKKYAYVSIVTSENYLVGLETMYLSLLQTGTTVPLYTLLPARLVRDNSETVKKLKDEGINIIEYDQSVVIPQTLVNNNNAQGDNRFNYTFDKLLIFGLTQFDKIVFLDSDIYILQNLDHLFEKPHMSAMIAGKSYPGNEDWVDLTSGIMTLVPEDGLVRKLEAAIPGVIEKKGACGDQDILQAYYSEWTKHPELDMGEKYGIMAGYADYYEKTLGYTYSGDVNDPKSVAIMHYAGEKKPWMQHWGFLSVLKQEIMLTLYGIKGQRNTQRVHLEYKRLIRKARRHIGITQ